MKNQSQSVIILYKNRVHLKYDTGIMICIIRTRREKKEKKRQTIWAPRSRRWHRFWKILKAFKHLNPVFSNTVFNVFVFGCFRAKYFT